MSVRNFPGSRALGALAVAIGAEHWRSDSTWVAVLFHHLTDGVRWSAKDPFVAGLGIDMPVHRFAERIDSLTNRYDIVGLDKVLAPPVRSARRKRLLICFDDAYASVVQLAAPLLAERDLPWCFFINPGLVGNKTIALDNFITYVSNTFGPTPLAMATGGESGSPGFLLRGALANYTPAERRQFVADLAMELGLDPATMAAQARLYLEAEDVRTLADAGVEIGNHTADHVSCRALDKDGVEEQVVESSVDIARLSGRPVRGFAYPYGSRTDVTPLVTNGLQRSGHDCAFLVEGRDNNGKTDPYQLHRISLAGSDDRTNALELAVLPPLRSLRAGARKVHRVR